MSNYKKLHEAREALRKAANILWNLEGLGPEARKAATLNYFKLVEFEVDLFALQFIEVTDKIKVDNTELRIIEYTGKKD